jgi:hypothetical protein
MERIRYYSVEDFERFCFEHQKFKVKGDNLQVRDDIKKLFRFKMKAKEKKYVKGVHDSEQIYRYYSIREEKSMNIIKLPDWHESTSVYMADYHRSLRARN